MREKEMKSYTQREIEEVEKSLDTIPISVSRIFLRSGFIPALEFCKIFLYP